MSKVLEGIVFVILAVFTLLGCKTLGEQEYILTLTNRCTDIEIRPELTKLKCPSEKTQRGREVTNER